KTSKPRPKDDPASAAVEAEREKVTRALMTVLRVARDDAHLTQRDMAEYLGCSEDVISNMESRRTPISLADAILWARRSNVADAEFSEHSLFALRKRKQGTR